MLQTFLKTLRPPGKDCLPVLVVQIVQRFLSFMQGCGVVKKLVTSFCTKLD